MSDIMNHTSRIFVAGHKGLVGSALCRRLTGAGFSKLVLKTRAELDLCDQRAVDRFFEMQQPEYVFLSAAKVGGILANSTYPAEFIRDNLALQTNVIHSAWKHGVHKLLFLGSSCVYPRLTSQPIREEYLLTSSLEPTNEWYAIAKIAGIKLAEAYRKQYGFNAISAMPTNLYGPGDNFDLQNSHVLPALMRKFSDAAETRQPEVVVWGTGTPRREFLHVDDLADALVFLMLNYDESSPVNVGTGTDVTIAKLAEMVGHATGYEGTVKYDRTKPDGTPRKLLDTSRLSNLGWSPAITLDAGIASTYRWYCENRAVFRAE
jgi:GDP-L-fucose synthase